MLLFGVLLRFSVGTSKNHRLQTIFKTYSLPVFIEMMLFFIPSKKPISFHSIAIQIINYFLIGLMLLDKLSFIILLKVLLMIIYLFISVLFLETFLKSILFKGVYYSNDKRIKMNFEMDLYSIIINDTEYEGYLDLSFFNKYIFFENKEWFNNDVLECGEYHIKLNRKEKKFYFSPK